MAESINIIHWPIWSRINIQERRWSHVCFIFGGVYMLLTSISLFSHHIHVTSKVWLVWLCHYVFFVSRWYSYLTTWISSGGWRRRRISSRRSSQNATRTKRNVLPICPGIWPLDRSPLTQTRPLLTNGKLLVNVVRTCLSHSGMSAVLCKPVSKRVYR